MSVIKVKAHDQYLTITDNPVISAGDVDTNSIEFTIDDSWVFSDEVKLYAVFFTTQHDVTELLLTKSSGAYSCIIPDEFTNIEKKFYFGIIAKDRSNTVVKTSAIRGYSVINGTPNTQNGYVDWRQFKRDLIEQLNEQFDLELNNDSTTEEILTALATVEDGKKARKFFIDLLNSSFNLGLAYDDTDATITSAVSGTAATLLEIQENYNYLVNGLVEILGSESND